MIRKAAIREFLERPRKDYRAFKKWSETKADRRMETLPVRPPIWNKLELHQKICFLLGALLGRFFFINDTGTGKTLLSIALARYFRKLGLVRHVLVLVPRRINKTEWVAELELHSPKSSYLVLKGSSASKWEALEQSDALFVFETYSGLIRMVCSLEKTEKRGKKRNRLKPNKKLVAKLKEHFQGWIGDESTEVKNHLKLPFRIGRQLSKTAKMVFLLTGTPFNRDPADLWSQMFLVDKGYALGETLGLFRSAFYKEKDNYWGGKDFTFDPKKRKLLNDFLAHSSISYEADAASLPAVVPVRKVVSLPEEAEAYYQRAKDTIIAAHGNYEEIKNAFLRMRQISSGFIGYKDDETGERARFEFPQNPKLDLLLSTIGSVRPDHKIIVFYEYTYSGLRIVDELKEMGIAPLHLFGGTKSPETVRDSFKFDKKKQVLVLQNQFGFGLNIQVAKYGMYYEAPVSAIIRKQTRRRVERQRSLHKSVFIYDFIVRDTVDERILQFHKQGGSLFDAIVKGKVKL